MKTLGKSIPVVVALLAGAGVLHVTAKGLVNDSPARLKSVSVPPIMTTAYRLPTTITTFRGDAVVLSADVSSARRALPNVGTNYGYMPPPGSPRVLRDGFVNCDLPHPIAYVKFSTGYAELFRVVLGAGSWYLGMDYERQILHNPLVVNDLPGQTSLGITHVAGADGCVIWPAPGQPGYVSGFQHPDPYAPK
jgi:hypothetical protein